MIKKFYKSLKEYNKPKAWLEFYFYVKVPLGCLGNIADGIYEISSMQNSSSIFSAGLDFVNVALFIAVMAKTKFSYTLMIVAIALESIGLGAIGVSENGSVYPLIGLGYFLLNLVYFSKRKDFFQPTYFNFSSGIKKYVNIPEQENLEENVQEEPSLEEVTEHKKLELRQETESEVPRKIPQNNKLAQIKAEKITYCKKCGHLIDNTTKKCTGCGKQYFKPRGFLRKSSKILLIISLIANVCLVIYGGTMLAKYNRANEKVKQCKELILSLEESNNEYKEHLEYKEQEIEDLDNQRERAWEKYYEVKDKAEFLDQYIAFTTTSNHGYAYHKYDCYHLLGRDIYYWLIEEVQQSGYSACHDCY